MQYFQLLKWKKKAAMLLTKLCNSSKFCGHIQSEHTLKATAEMGGALTFQPLGIQEEKTGGVHFFHTV